MGKLLFKEVSILPQKQVFFFTTVFPAIVTLLGYFVPGWEYPTKLIVPLSLSTLYFFGLGIYFYLKLIQAKSDTTNATREFNELTREKNLLDNKISKYDDFVHKRGVFIHHGLSELGTLITEYEWYIKNSYRGQKYQDVRNEVGRVKIRTLEITNKEKRDFDEQLYNVQSNQDNR